MTPGTSFELTAPTRIVFGAGKVAEVPAAIGALGVRRCLLVTGRDPGRAAGLRLALESAGVAVTPFAVPGEPTVPLASDGAARARAEGCDGVVGYGGGSALDAAKAIAILATHDDPLDHLEVIGRGRPFTRPGLPFVAVPTTAGTGSEVTRNAVLASPEAGVKASLRSPLMLARVAIVDPDLLTDVPRPVLAASGLDALSQLIEPFLSIRANPFTDALAREGIRSSARSLRRAYTDGPDAPTREDLALASLFGGLCLANAGLGAVHGFAAPIGGSFEAPHGAVCAVLLPLVLEVNRRALAARAPDHQALPRLDELGRLLTGSPNATAEDAVAFVRDLVSALQIPGLGHYGVTFADVQALVTKAQVASSMKANPLPLTEAELTEIVERAIGVRAPAPIP